MDNSIKELYNTIEQRKSTPQEGSYTTYLFEAGLDKILKKCGEECTEAVIAAKNNDNDELKNEVCDLIYHLCVLMSNQGLPIDDVFDELDKRSAKIGNLKQFKQTDKLT